MKSTKSRNLATTESRNLVKNQQSEEFLSRNQQVMISSCEFKKISNLATKLPESRNPVINQVKDSQAKINRVIKSSNEINKIKKIQNQ